LLDKKTAPIASAVIIKNMEQTSTKCIRFSKQIPVFQNFCPRISEVGPPVLSKTKYLQTGGSHFALEQGTKRTRISINY